MLCCSGITCLWAQVKPLKAVVIEADKEYLIYDAFNTGQNRTGFRYVNAGSTNIETASGKGDPGNYDLAKGAIWTAESDGVGGFKFKNRVTSEYFNGTSTGADGTIWTVLAAEDATNEQMGGNRADYLDKTCFVVYNGSTYWNGNPSSMATWSNGHPYQFYTFKEEQTLKITYKCIGPKGEELKTTTDDVKKGFQYILKAPAIDFYKCVSKSYNGEVLKSDTIKEVTGNMEIVCTYADYLPFQITNITPDATDFPADAKFYKMAIHADKFLVEYNPSDPTKMKLSHKIGDVTGEIQDSLLWCFSGDRETGFRIYNRATGVKKILYLSGDPSAESFGSEGSDAFVHMAQLDTITETPVGWKLAMGYFANGYYLGKPIGENEYRMNKQAANLVFWTGGSDGGSTFTFEYYNAQSPYTPLLKDLIVKVAGSVKTDSVYVGNPGYASAADFNTMYTVYAKVVADTLNITPEKAKADFQEMTAAYDLYKSKRNDIIEQNVAYTMTNTNDRGALYYDPDGSDIFAWSSGRTGAGPIDSLNACWTVVNTDIEGEYYLYNIGRKQFLRYGADKETDWPTKLSWRFTSIPTAVTVTYEQNGFAFKPVGGTGIGLSLSNNYTHPVITYYGATDVGVPFRLIKKGQITDAEKQTIANVLEAGKKVGLTDVWTGTGVTTAGANATNVVVGRAVAVGSEEEPTSVEGMTLNLSNANYFSGLKIYATTVSTLSGIADEEKVLLKEIESVEGSEMNVSFDVMSTVSSDPLYLWIVADLNGAPQAGDKVGVSVKSLKYSTESAGAQQMESGNKDFVTSVNLFDAQTTIFDRGTLKSKNFGSPAIAKAPNGDLIAVTDVRYAGTGDLGSHQMDIAASISKDNGATWSTPQIILKGDSISDDGFGYSSPCIAVDKENSKMNILISGGKKAIGDGNKNIYVLESTDNGETWSKSSALEVLWEPGDAGESYIYLAAITGNGIVLKNQPEGDDVLIHNGATVYPVRTKIAEKTYTHALVYDPMYDQWQLSNTPVFNSVQNATLQETAEGNIVFTASTSRKDGARLKNVWTPEMVTENGSMEFGKADSIAVTGTSNAAGLTVDANGTTILTNIALKTTKLMLNVSDDNCANWGSNATKELQTKHASASAIVAADDNSVSVFYQTRVLGMDNGYALTCIKVPYSYFKSIVDNIGGVESDKVEESKKDGKVYDGLGRQVTTPSKGFYIQDGKKYVK